MTQGIVGFDPRARDAAGGLDALLTGDGRRLGPRLREEIVRELRRLNLVMEQLAVIEAERDAVARGETSTTPASDADAVDPDHTMIAALNRLKGIGTNDASVLVREAFWRNFNNRREVAAWSGLAPTPWSSGATARDQGITKAGPPVVRSHLIQISSRWLQWQPQSGLAQWFQQRTQGATGRVRRVMIVALASKLLVSLWRFATISVVPSGAVVV